MTRRSPRSPDSAPSRACLGRDLFGQMIDYARRNLTNGLVPREVIGSLSFPLPEDEAMRVAMRLADPGPYGALCSFDAHSNAFSILAYTNLERHGGRSAGQEAKGVKAAQTRWRAGDATSNARSNASSNARSIVTGDASSNARSIADANGIHRARAHVHTEQEQEKESSSVGVDDPRAHAPARERTRDPDDDDPHDDGGDLDGRIVIMLAAHGFTVEPRAGARRPPADHRRAAHRQPRRLTSARRSRRSTVPASGHRSPPRNHPPPGRRARAASTR